MAMDPTITLIIACIIAAAVWLLFGQDKKKSKKSKGPIALDPENFQEFPLIKVDDISHDVKRFRFGLQSPQHVLGLPIGQHISFKYTDENGKDVMRSYTPTSSDDELGYVEFVVKIYYKNVHPKFPDGGKMSQHLADLKIGDTLKMRGPKGSLTYNGRGNFTIKRKLELVNYNNKKKIGMIAGGTGITPMLQVISAVLKNDDDRTEMWLIFANQTEEDILLRKELEAIDNSRLHLFYTLDRPPADWKFGTGFINAAMCKDHLPSPAADTMFFVCGPPPMIEYACKPAFKEIGIEDDDWFAF